MRATDGALTRAAWTFWTVTSTSCPITTKLCPTILRSLMLSSLCTLTYRYNCEDMLCATLPVLLCLLVQLAEHFIRHLISGDVYLFSVFVRLLVLQLYSVSHGNIPQFSEAWQLNDFLRRTDRYTFIPLILFKWQWGHSVVSVRSYFNWTGS